ncbi:glycosyltransferase family 2 protein [bacterium]|nr:glycosyltransferase family 2 protein [bacterium]
MDLSIIIVNYNGAHFLTPCLDSIFNSETRYRYEVIVVDNASIDISASILSQYPSKINVIINQHNSGFSAGNNQGVRQSSGRYIFLLNNDTVLEKNTIQTLMEYYEAHPEIGAIAPKLLNGDGSLQSPGSILMRWIYTAEKPREVSFIAGAAVLTKRSVYDKIGGLDEHYFFYNEDVDFCKTLKKNGYKIIYLPLASLTHFGGLSTRTRKEASIVEGYRGGLYFCLKHYGVVIYGLYSVILLIDVVPRLIWNMILSVVRQSDRQYLKAYLRILWIIFTGDIRYRRKPI